MNENLLYKPKIREDIKNYLIKGVPYDQILYYLLEDYDIIISKLNLIEFIENNKFFQ